MEIKVVKDDGENIAVELKSGFSLMDMLRDAGLVEGTCGGMASCGTCHVFVDTEWAEKITPQTEDEGYMLESLADVVEVTAQSRLACQIELTDAQDGLYVTIAPQI